MSIWMAYLSYLFVGIFLEKTSKFMFTLLKFTHRINCFFIQFIVTICLKLKVLPFSFFYTLFVFGHGEHREPKLQVCIFPCKGRET